MSWLGSLFGRRSPGADAEQLLNTKPFLVANYLEAWEASDDVGKRRHVDELWRAAEATAGFFGEESFVELLGSGNTGCLLDAMAQANDEFDRLRSSASDLRYWATAYAAVSLLIQNRIGLLEKVPSVKAIAENAAHLYAAEAAYRALGK